MYRNLKRNFKKMFVACLIKYLYNVKKKNRDNTENLGKTLYENKSKNVNKFRTESIHRSLNMNQ